MSGNKSSLIARIITAIAAVGLLIYFAYPYVSSLTSFTSSYNEDAKATLALDASQMDLFKAANRKRPELTEDIQDGKPDFTRYIYFRQQLVYVDHRKDDMPVYTHAMDVSVNEMLGLTANADRQWDGMIVSYDGLAEVGFYETGGNPLSNLISPESGQNSEQKYSSAQKAYKPYLTLLYVSLPSYTVVHRDTVWGGEPPHTLRKGDSPIGKQPSDEQIAEAIRKTIDNGQLTKQ